MQPNEPEIDFFAALKEMQAEVSAAAATTANGNNGNGNNGNGTNESETNVCLITHQPLNAYHVQLTCGHKFNYEPLFQEVMRQKGRLGIHNFHQPIATNQIKCPYCRSITNELLPYIGTSPHPVIKRMTGVNAPAHMCMAGVPCSANKCHANAFYEHNQILYCHKHCQAAMKPTKPKAAASSRCLAQNQSGKNKGAQCKRSATEGSVMCKMHLKCNVFAM
jgi:hypothetical protein